MSRICLLSTLLAAFATTGCTKSEEAQAERRTGDSTLMPSAKPVFEAEYVADQSTIKTLPARKISYNALDSFRDGEEARVDKKPEPRKAQKQVARSTPKAASGAAKAAPPAGATGAGSFWQRVGMKALMGGGRPSPSGARPPATKKGGETKEDSGQSEETEEDAASNDSVDEDTEDKPKDDNSKPSGD